VPLEVAGRERVDVHEPFERVVVAVAVAVAAGRARVEQPAPERGDGQARALGHVGDPVAVARGLAREEHDPAGAQDAQELRERAVQLRQVMEHRVPEDEVERRVLERQRRGVADRGLDVETEPAGVAPQRREHARRHVGADRRPHDALLHEVEREVAGARPDLQRAGERTGVGAEQLLDLAEHLGAADLAEVDTPLGVVLGRRHVVVAAVDVEDVLGALGCGHRGRKSRTGALIPGPVPGRTRRGSRAR
jgi:hypothetical protein